MIFLRGTFRSDKHKLSFTNPLVRKEVLFAGINKILVSLGTDERGVCSDNYHVSCAVSTAEVYSATELILHCSSPGFESSTSSAVKTLSAYGWMATSYGSVSLGWSLWDGRGIKRRCHRNCLRDNLLYVMV